MNKWITRPQTRKWLYKVLLAAIGLAVGYGLIAGDTAALWVTLIAAAVGLPLADANVDTTEPDEGLGE